MTDNLPEYLTTRELADLLRIKERKVYDLVATESVPYSRATGKLLFSRREIETWINSKHSGMARGGSRPPAVLLGSHDPLLEWAVRASGAELAIHLGGSGDGLERFDAGQGVAAGVHLFEPETGGWNAATVAARFSRQPAVLVEFSRRERGLVIDPGLVDSVKCLADLRGQRLVPRPAGAGSQVLLEYLMQQAQLGVGDFSFIEPVYAEVDAVMAVREGKADGAFGLRCLARQFRRGFVPAVVERFDLLVDRHAWFERPMQTLLRFCQSDAFKQRAVELEGYDISGLGTVHFNSPAV